ncbi:MAG: flagellar biosynthetic protein FliR [Pirellulales bacterium]
MGALIEQFSIQVATTFIFVLARVGGMTMTAPIFGSVEIPLPVRAFLTITISLLIAPLQWGRLTVAPTNLIDLAIIVAGEALIGVALGIGLMIVMAGIQIAGQIASQLGGMSLADVFNPGFDSDMPLFSHLISLVMLAVFSIIGGHRRLIEALMHTFAELPIGSPGRFESAGTFMITLLSESMVLGVRAPRRS